MLQVQVLDCRTWPQHVTSQLIDVEKKVRSLCERFGISYVKAQDGFRDLIDQAGAEISDNLRELTTAISTLPVASADAERGFNSHEHDMYTVYATDWRYLVFQTCYLRALLDRH